MSSAILTYTKRYVDPFNASPDDIHILDIGRGLSNITRFGGQLDRFYSVAAHSVMMSRVAPEGQKLWAFLHDASEAYLMDIPTPIKKHPAMEGYRNAEESLLGVIAEAYGLPTLEPVGDMKRLDTLMAVAEMQVLMGWYFNIIPNRPIIEKHNITGIELDMMETWIAAIDEMPRTPEGQYEVWFDTAVELTRDLDVHHDLKASNHITG